MSGQLYCLYLHYLDQIPKYATSPKVSRHKETPSPESQQLLPTQHWPVFWPSPPFSRRGKAPPPSHALSGLKHFFWKKYRQCWYASRPQEPNTIVLWGTHYVTPSFARTTPENSKVLTFTRAVRLGQILATVKMDPAFLEMEKMDMTLAEDMEAALTLISPGTHCLPNDTFKPERVQVPLVSIAQPPLLHPLMAAPFISRSVWS